jgi:hypothetical protein
MPAAEGRRTKTICIRVYHNDAPFFVNGNREFHYLINHQPFNRPFAHLAAFAAAHHTYFTGWQTKLAVRAGFRKRNVNAPIPLTCK